MYCPSPIVASLRIISNSVKPLIVRITATTVSANAVTTFAGEGDPSARKNAVSNAAKTVPIKIATLPVPMSPGTVAPSTATEMVNTSRCHEYQLAPH